MKPIVVSHRSSAPAHRVFAVASDFANAPSYVTGILRTEMLTKGPVGRGTRFRETRKMFGKEATEEMEVVAFDPPRSYALRAFSCGAEYLSEIRCVQDGAGTRLEMEFRATPVSFFAKVMCVLGGAFTGSMAKMIGKDLEEVCRAAERGPPPAAAPPGTAPSPAV